MVKSGEELNDKNGRDEGVKDRRRHVRVERRVFVSWSGGGKKERMENV